jgi:glycosyltransferase involved in cell wall biosynthesis
MRSFSVLMPVYYGDDRELLLLALKSISANSLAPEQVVIVIDGPISADKDEIISRFKSSAPFSVMLVRLETNRGITAALNAGLTRCECEIVIRCDADDINHHDRFERLLSEFETDSSLVLLGSSIIERGASGAKFVRRAPCSKSDILRTMWIRNPFNHMSVAFRKSAVISAGGYKAVPFREDFDLWARILGRSGNCKNLESPLVTAHVGNGMYRRRGGISQVRGEILLQRTLRKYKHSGAFKSGVSFLVRFSNLIVGHRAREFIYTRCLRSRS